MENMRTIRIAAVVCLTAAGTAACSQSAPKYLDARVPVEQRVDDLLSRMTLEEKIGQIANSDGSQAIPRLKVPPLFKTEALHGFAAGTGATVFPQAIAMGATFDAELAGKVGKVSGYESRIANRYMAWAPVLNLARDVRWGRVEETYGESPYLASRLGVAWINGFQSEGVMAVPKHYAVHGAPLGGRDSNDVGFSDRMLREIFLPAFRAAFEEAHAQGVMPAYSSWQGLPDNASPVLLQQILRQEWGFDGVVVSDCGALENFYSKQGIAHSPAEAAAIGMWTGVNLNCGGAYKTHGAEAVRQGLVSDAELNDAVRPVLRAKFRLGLFDRAVPEKPAPEREKLAEFDAPEARALAREVETEAAVLLKNERSLLPLRKDIKSIAVIGPDAEVAQSGDYTGRVMAEQMVSILEGVRSHVSAGTQVLFARGLTAANSMDTSGFAEAVAAAKKAQVAVVVVGDDSLPHKGKQTTGEGHDSATLELPGAQRELVRAIAETGTPVVLVIVNGKPFTMQWEAEHIPAILVSWFAGEEGGNAIAGLLFGDRNPSGHLPLTWPRTVGQVPLTYDYLPSGRDYDYVDMSGTPQWRFGFGLSYTRFRYSNLRMESAKDDPGNVDVRVDVTNAGDRDGDEVSQLYVSDVVASVMRPVLELEGFQRTKLKAGETKTVAFHLTPYQLSILDGQMVRRVEPGVFRVHVGHVVPDIPASVTKERFDHRQTAIAFDDPTEGISGEFNETRDYAARFVYSLTTPANVRAGQTSPATVTVRNDGNLTDVTETKLFNESQIGSWSFEIAPGQTKTHVFPVTMTHAGTLVLQAGAKVVTSTVAMSGVRTRSR